MTQKKKAYKWGVNYTLQSFSHRTTEIELFDRLKKARTFASGKYGYITRIGYENTELHEMFGGFMPSARESASIASITKSN